MSKSANAGELRTPITVMSVSKPTDDEGYDSYVETNVFGTGAVLMCKWVNAHGTEVFAAAQLQLREPATVTVRYSPKIDRTCLIYRGSDPEPYEIISIDNVEERDAWLEIKVQRKEAAR